MSDNILAQLIFEKGVLSPYTLNKIITTIGRNESNDIVLDDAKVSSFHGNILSREDGYHVLDMKSRNGIKVNGVLIESSPLKTGDKIEFGDQLLRFECIVAESIESMETPIERLNQKIQTMALQSPSLRKEVESILQEVEKQQTKTREELKALEERNQALDQALQSIRNTVISAPGGAMERTLGLVRKLATADLPVLITGETGTGKTHLARIIHQMSARNAKGFCVIDCATIPSNLIESELFGYEKGAFTGAVNRKIGKVESHAGGTVFLDEIGDLPLELQGKLLRFVQEGRFERLGSNETQQVDVRLIAATHYNLEARVQEGKFRQDLFYRLHVLPLKVPALRERSEDIPVLGKYFVHKHFGQEPWAFSPDAIDAMQKHNWPGNVRELENRIQRAWLFHVDDIITASDLGLETPAAAQESVKDAENFTLEKKTLEQYREEFEGAILKRCLQYYKGNITRTSDHLQISRNTCKTMVKRYNLAFDPKE